jgi:ribonuclease HI
VLIYSDSKYVIDSVTKGWVFGWVKKGFKGKKNPDLWRRFLKIYPKNRVKFEWVKGHANNPGNERVDKLAVAASNDKKNHLVDEGYEAQQNGDALF